MARVLPGIATLWRTAHNPLFCPTDFDHRYWSTDPTMNAIASPIYESAQGKIVKVEADGGTLYYAYSAGGKLLGTKATYFAAAALIQTQWP
jgi:hypothetical protein